MSLFIPVSHRSGRLTAVDSGGVLHAVDPVTTRRRDRRYKRIVIRQTKPSTWATNCGAKVEHLFASTAVNPQGEPIGSIALAWPPPARNDHGPRCAVCWAVGRHRPDISWSKLEPLVPLFGEKS